MSKVLEEVLSANEAYTENFGEKRSYQCRQDGTLPFSPAWMPA
jgi:hypothetical protein